MIDPGDKAGSGAGGGPEPAGSAGSLTGGEAPAVAALFDSYLDDLRRELYLRFGRTRGARPVQRILEEARAHLEDAYTAELARSQGVVLQPDEAVARRIVARFGEPRDVAHAYVGIPMQPFDEASATARLRHAPPDRFEKETPAIALWRDLRVAGRSLARAPGFTLAFVLTLGLGIGANTAIFSLANGVLLRPLPHRDGEELVYLRHSARLGGIDNALFSVPEIRDYRAQVPSFAGVAEFSTMPFTLLGFDEPRQVTAGLVTGNYFPLIGLDAVLGRVIASADDGPAAAPVAVLTYEYWQSAFGGDPAVVGRLVTLGGLATEIVGVVEPAPPYPEHTDLFANLVTSPHHVAATMQTDRVHRMTEGFARLAPGAALEQARSEIEQVEGRLHDEYPEAYAATEGYAVSATMLHDQLASRARPTLYLLLGVAGFVLVIACANVANLTLARALRRRHELQIRASLGAGRGALRRQLLVESLVPALAGAALGLLLAYAGLGAMVRFAARYSARASEIDLDATVFLVALVSGVGAACLFAFLPRLPGQGQRALSGAGQTHAGATGRHMQRALVVAQVAVCFVLLIGAGLLLRSLLNLSYDSGGLDLDDVLVVEIPPALGGGARTPEQDRAFYDGLLAGAGALPGVRNVALGSRLPLQGAPEGLGALLAAMDFEIEGRPIEAGAPSPRADFRVVTPPYFETMGMSILGGRGLAATDTADSAPVLVINQAMAGHYFPDRDPVGSRLRWTDDIGRFLAIDQEPRTIVGVVSDSHDFGVANEVPHIAFHPFDQYPGATVLFVRAAQPHGLIRPVVDMVHRLDPAQVVTRVMTLDDIRDESIAPQRLNATLVGAFALLAMFIAAVGVAGVLAFSVSQRSRELGVRAALGATPARLLGGVLREGAVTTAAGLLIGGVASLALSRLLGGLLFGVEPTDALTLATVTLVLIGVALTAAWVPARRAAAADPIRALRGN
jgi:predicted permease